MKKSSKIFTLFGMDIRLHYSWYFVFILIAWSLAVSVFPAYCAGKLGEMPDCTGITSFHFWGMGLSSALLLFLSVLLHELSHSLVAKAKKIKVESITLFFFGGVAAIEEEEMKPSSELQMALAGPAFSLLLAGVFYLINLLNGNVIINAITFYLYQLNFILALFNLVPGYPLDGGRAFRAVLHWYYHDLRKATYLAALVGKFFAGVLVVLGLLGFLGLAAGTGGLWFIFLGVFLYLIAGASYEQVVIREVLSRVPVRELLRKEYSALSPEMKFTDFVRTYQSSGEDAFVVQDGKFIGLLDIKNVEMKSRGSQTSLRLKQIARPLAQVKGLQAGDNTYTAFRRFAEEGLELLPVFAGKKIVGFVSRQTVLHRLNWELKYGFFLKERRKRGQKGEIKN